MSANSCDALGANFPHMAGLLELDLSGNFFAGSLEVLVRGLADCSLHKLILGRNRISDDGFVMLIQGLPASVMILNLSRNEIVCARATMATIQLSSLRSNSSLIAMDLIDNNITETGWNEFSSVLCDTASINATHGSNHTLQYLGGIGIVANSSQDVRKLLQLNFGQYKSRVAATKILQNHRHLDMKPLFDRKLDLLPHVVAWLDCFAESRLDLKLSSIFEFVRAMPMEVVDGAEGGKKGKKRRHNI